MQRWRRNDWKRLKAMLQESLPMMVRMQLVVLFAPTCCDKETVGVAIRRQRDRKFTSVALFIQHCNAALASVYDPEHQVMVCCEWTSSKGPNSPFLSTRDPIDGESAKTRTCPPTLHREVQPNTDRVGRVYLAGGQSVCSDLRCYLVTAVGRWGDAGR